MTAPDSVAAIGSALALQMTAGQVAQLERYIDELQHWNGTYNLTAVRDRPGMLTQHIADCMAVVPQLRPKVTDGTRLLDVGSGGGLPGAVFAVLLPHLDVTCVDAVGKKTAFVRHVSGALALRNLHAVHSRVDDLELPRFDLITSRAFSTLSNFTSLSARLLKPGGSWLALKGRVPDDEIAALPGSIEVFHVEQLRVPGLDAQRCLVWMRSCAGPVSN